MIECRDIMRNCEKWKKSNPGWFGLYGHTWGNRCKFSSSRDPKFGGKWGKYDGMVQKHGAPTYPVEIACQKSCKNTCTEKRITKGRIHLLNSNLETFTLRPLKI